MIQKFLLSLSFFTRIPIGKRDFGSLTLAQAAIAFPMVGAVIGLLDGGFYLLMLALGLPKIISAWLTVGFHLLLTGALHEDGFADTADALATGRSIEQKLAIMKDSRIGSYGVLALIIIISLKAELIASLEGNLQSLAVFIATGAASRAFMVLFMHYLPYARNNGLAAMSGKPTEINTLTTIAIGSSVLLLAASPTAVFSCVVTLFVAYVILRYVFTKHFGGITGDTLGASQQVGEIVILLVFCLLPV